jgi:hypothetical protein
MKETSQKFGQSFLARANYIFYQLIVRGGYTEQQASGILANLAVESGRTSSPGVVELGKSSSTSSTVPVKGAGFGIGQWTYRPRQEALMEYAESNNSKPDNLDTQIGFLIHEMQVLNPEWDSKLRRTNTPQEAAVTFMKDFEAPRETLKNAQERSRLAVDYFNDYNDDNHIDTGQPMPQLVSRPSKVDSSPSIRKMGEYSDPDTDPLLPEITSAAQSIVTDSTYTDASHIAPGVDTGVVQSQQPFVATEYYSVPEGMTGTVITDPQKGEVGSIAISSGNVGAIVDKDTAVEQGIHSTAGAYGITASSGSAGAAMSQWMRDNPVQAAQIGLDAVTGKSINSNIQTVGTYTSLSKDTGQDSLSNRVSAAASLPQPNYTSVPVAVPVSYEPTPPPVPVPVAAPATPGMVIVTPDIPVSEPSPIYVGGGATHDAPVAMTGSDTIFGGAPSATAAASGATMSTADAAAAAVPGGDLVAYWASQMK